MVLPKVSNARMLHLHDLSLSLVRGNTYLPHEIIKSHDRSGNEKRRIQQVSDVVLEVIDFQIMTCCGPLSVVHLQL